MKRRDATALLTALAGGALISSPILLPGCREDIAPEVLAFFTKDEMILLEEVAETILPTTPKSGGAKAAGIGAFMDRYVADCLEESDQEILRSGLGQLDQRSQEQSGKSFLKSAADKRHDLLVTLDIEAEAYQQKRQGQTPPHYFTLFKGLTLLGYFTSEVGATQALRYVPVPGRYEGAIPYQDGDKAWAI